jgi:hypothetical protein
MILDLIQATALLLALSLLQGLCIRYLELKPRLAEIASGLIFGSVCIVGMMIPINLAPGVIVDGRSVVLSMAGLFGGPLTGVIAGVVAAPIACRSVATAWWSASPPSRSGWGWAWPIASSGRVPGSLAHR